MIITCPECATRYSADAAKFPEQGRTKIRKNFPSDYVFAAMSAPESLAQSMQAQLEHYDSVDR